MEHTISKIISKPSDYKICPFCGNINWYENNNCVVCNSFPNILSVVDLMTEEQMNDWYENEKTYFEIEGYSREDMDIIYREV